MLLLPFLSGCLLSMGSVKACRVIDSFWYLGVAIHDASSSVQRGHYWGPPSDPGGLVIAFVSHLGNWTLSSTFCGPALLHTSRSPPPTPRPGLSAAWDSTLEPGITAPRPKILHIPVSFLHSFLLRSIWGVWCRGREGLCPFCFSWSLNLNSESPPLDSV